MDPYGPVWVRMVPEDSLGASWGLLGPWGGQKGVFGVFGGGGGVPPPWALLACLGPISLLTAYAKALSLRP